MTADPEADFWTIEDVALHWGVKPETVRSYRSRKKGELPEADRMVGRTPVWHPATIVAFQRPGRGARTDLTAQDPASAPDARSGDGSEGA